MDKPLASAPASHLPENKERAIQALIARCRFADAAIAAEAFRESFPDRVSGYILGSHAAAQIGDINALQSLANHAEQLAPDRLDVAFLQVDVKIRAGDVADALIRLGDIAEGRATTRHHFELLGSKWMELGQFQNALEAGERLAAIEGAELAGLSMIAAAQTALGQMEKARKAYDQLIRLAPEMTDSWYLRASLQKASVADNQVAAASKRLERLARGSKKTIPVHYALARELEDLGDYQASFQHLLEGATIRRRHLAYDVETDIATMRTIAHVFDQDWADNAPHGYSQGIPIFVLGLPRSGTTLVDRILSSHSSIASLGEVNDLACAVVRLAGRAASKQDLVNLSAQIDPGTLGADYLVAQRGYGRRAEMLIDKTPANYLYLGLILKALPNARVIHLKRHPMASGYAMFKTLFRMGYPFSYDLTDLGRYIAAYNDLMAHWHKVFPGRIHTVEYEQLVANQERESRRLIEYCGLGWEDACLRFDKNLAPTATASAAQVREPLHNRSVDLWQRYEDQLAPLRETLRSEGIEV